MFVVMATDGRDSRWDEHRATRRTELVSHSLRAIRVHGPGVGMEEIAARAGTSKTVIYRHFGGRAGLYDAVVGAVHGYIRDSLTVALQDTEVGDAGHLVETLADSYLSLVEKDPHIYRFVMNGPGGSGAIDPAGRVPSTIAAYVATIITDHRGTHGVSESCARTWGHGFVGFVQAVADRWMDQPDREPRDVVVQQISQLLTPAFADAMSAPANS
ncbi:TetR/AcrR family transcriptional regulator [Demequina sediminicola]|uniref:TetR/AcrR family transcriptional regulator n=1 Tax=Demequina sediminicola TaxID=1095026 RepID=UPI000780AAE7|nr:TetR/AcrR family transcriptional regulator [Demequina sediminicola]